MARRKEQTGEQLDSAIEQRVTQLKVRELSETQAAKLVNEHQIFRMKALDKLYALWLGHGWKALGFENWGALCEAKFGYEERSAQNMIHFARVHYETKPLLTDGSNAMVTLETMPKYATLHLQKMEAEQRVPILEELAQLDRIPTELDVLEAIPTEQLSGGQVNRIIALRKQSEGKTWIEQRDTLVETGRRVIDKLFTLYMDDNENLEGFYSVIRSSFPQLARAWGIEPFAEGEVPDTLESAAKDYEQFEGEYDGVTQEQYEQSEQDMMEEALEEEI